MNNAKPDLLVGGLFGLECHQNFEGTKPPFLSGREIFLSNARSGIWFLVDRLRPPQVWVPSYTCHTVVRAVEKNVTALRFYEVGSDLNVRSAEWLSEVGFGDVVILIDYFGFPYDHDLGALIMKRGAWVLEDACQALLSVHVGTSSDFVLFSPRKWIGVPDGGILRFPESLPLVSDALVPPPSAWWMKAFQASVLRREFDDGLPIRSWFNIFRETEFSAPYGPYAMSQLSMVLLNQCVDYGAIAKKRVDNYRALLERLSHYALFPRLDPGVVPSGFPVRIEKRDEVRQALFDRQIYPPVHWVIDGVIPPRYADNHRLSREIMTLPCDQRYAAGDMERISEIFLQCLEPNT